MPVEEAREYLGRHVRFHGWPDTAVREIVKDPYLSMSIQRYIKLDADLSSFSFEQWMSLVEDTRSMREHVRAGDSKMALFFAQDPYFAWDKSRDRRRVLSWMYQAMWNCWVCRTETASKAAPTAK